MRERKPEKHGEYRYAIFLNSFYFHFSMEVIQAQAICHQQRFDLEQDINI